MSRIAGFEIGCFGIGVRIGVLELNWNCLFLELICNCVQRDRIGLEQFFLVSELKHQTLVFILITTVQRAQHYAMHHIIINCCRVKLA